MRLGGYKSKKNCFAFTRASYVSFPLGKKTGIQQALLLPEKQMYLVSSEGRPGAILCNGNVRTCKSLVTHRQLPVSRKWEDFACKQACVSSRIALL